MRNAIIFFVILFSIPCLLPKPVVNGVEDYGFGLAVMFGLLILLLMVQEKKKDTFHD